MVQAAPARNACRVRTETGHTLPTTLAAPDARPERPAPDRCGRYAVHGREGQLGVLQAVLSAQRLLLLDAPQAPGGVLLIPFEAIEQIRVDERTIRLRPARDLLELWSASRRDDR